MTRELPPLRTDHQDRVIVLVGILALAVAALAAAGFVVIS